MSLRHALVPAVAVATVLLGINSCRDDSPPAAARGRAAALVRGGGDWPAYRHDIHSTWYNPGLFTAADALALVPVWSFNANSSTFAQPIVAGGAVYLTTAGSKGGKIYALDASTGAQRWVRSFANNAIDPCTGAAAPTGIQGAPTVADGVVYIGGSDGVLYALDAATGATRWQAPIADPTKGEVMLDSPVVSTALGRVFIAQSSASEQCQVVPHIAAVDLVTGVAKIRSYLQSGNTGAGIWSTLTVDEAAGRVYAATGNSEVSTKPDPLAEAFVAFDAETLDVVDHYQVASDPNIDEDFGASPTLFTAADGTPLIGTANKNGWLYVLRRANLAAGPIWKYQLAVYGGPTSGKSDVVAPSFADGVLYGSGEQTPAGEPSQVVAFEPGTGVVRWKHINKGFVYPGMPVMGDVLVVGETFPGNATGVLELLNRSDGTVIRSFDVTTGPIFGAPTLANGMLLYTDSRGHLQVYALPPGADGGTPDAGSPDAGAPDAGAPDAGTPDAGAPDAGTPDAGTPDAGAPDGGAPDGGTGGSVVFEDQLAGSGGLGSGWTVASGSFARTAAGAQPQAALSYAFAKAAAPDAQTVSVTLSIAASTRYNGVMARGAAGAALQNHYAGYWNSDGTLWIARRNNWAYTYLASTRPMAQAGASHRIALRTASTAAAVELTLLLDGTPVLSFLDTSAQRLTSAGLAGIFSYEGNGSVFGDFVIDTSVAGSGGGPPDGGVPDAGTPDAGTPDAGTPDGGAPDGGVGGGSVVFDDRLTGSGGLGSGWTAASGSFARSAAGAQPQAALSYAFANATPPDAQTVSATLNIAASTRYNGVMARGVPGSPLQNHYAGYWNSDGTLWIARRNNWTYTYLASTRPIAPVGASHRIELRTASTATAVQLTLLLDGTPVLSVVDTSAQRLSSAGRAGVFSWEGRGAVFRDFLLETP